jgi:hypothetical protein
MTMSPVRIAINKKVPAVPCERCGFNTLQVAELVNENGETYGRTVVCTACQAHRQPRAEGQPATRARTA